jgi:hypothetical protein
MPLKRYRLVVLLGGVSRFSTNLNLRRLKYEDYWDGQMD